MHRTALENTGKILIELLKETALSLLCISENLTVTPLPLSRYQDSDDCVGAIGGNPSQGPDLDPALCRDGLQPRPHGARQKLRRRCSGQHAQHTDQEHRSAALGELFFLYNLVVCIFFLGQY